MALLGGIGKTKIELDARVLTFVAGGYVNCIASDVGKPVVGDTTTDSGILLSYDNTAREWLVEPDAAGDLFDQAEAITITGGTGEGTTAGASVLKSHTFSWLELNGAPRFYFPEEKIGPFKLGDKSKTQFKEGHYFNAEIMFYALTTHDTVLDAFLKVLDDYRGNIYCYPHLDYPDAGSPHKYQVLKDNGWPYEYFKKKLLGFSGGIKLVGIKLLTGPWAEET